MFKELDVIELTTEIPPDRIWEIPPSSPLSGNRNLGKGLKAGEIGTIVYIQGAGEALEVEFLGPGGDTVAIATILPSQARKSPSWHSVGRWKTRGHQMTRVNRTVGDRQQALEVENKERGGFTVAGAKCAYESIGGKELHCTISKHCRTQVFEFPRSKSCLTKSELHEPIFGSDSVSACLVTDLLDYFAETKGLHYSISPSLRFEIEELDQKIKSQGEEQFPVSVVIEECNEITPVRMDKGECCIGDEVRMFKGDLQQVLVGGREGEQFITAWATVDGNWPEVPKNQHYVNMILAAVRVEQEMEGPIRKHLDQSCFVTDDGRFVDIMRPTIGGARVGTAMQLDERDYKDKASRIRKAITRLGPDMQTAHIALLINAMYADEYKDDTYNRLQYLRLWQSLSETYKKYLGYLGRDAINQDKAIIAGKKTLEELTKYRNDIAHWWTGSIDEGYLSDIMRTINKLLKRKYF